MSRRNTTALSAAFPKNALHLRHCARSRFGMTKGDLAVGNEYVDHFIDAQTFEWQSQNQTVQSSRHGQIINGSLPGHDVHLFVRPNRLRGAKAAPFTYCGVVAFQKWEGEKPITVTWKLSNPVPDHLRRLFKIEV